MNAEAPAYSRARDFAVVALFGLGSPWAWVLLSGLLAIAEAPVLAALSRVIPLSKSWMSWYLTGYGVIVALLCAVVIALPLGLVVRRPPWLVWLQFALMFWIALALAAWLAPEPVALSVFYAHPNAWLFLGASALLIMLGRKLGQRRANA